MSKTITLNGYEYHSSCFPIIFRVCDFEDECEGAPCADCLDAADMPPWAYCCDECGDRMCTCCCPICHCEDSGRCHPASQHELAVRLYPPCECGNVGCATCDADEVIQ